MKLEAQATDTTPSYEVRQRVLSVLESEVTQDALLKRCEEAERTALQAAECHARETCRADALQKRVAELEGALGTLEKAASYTVKLGAVTGAHWLGLGTALIKARAALTGGKDE